MKFEMICLDIDGTLLNSRGKINPAVLQSVCQAYERGVHIVISTGRMYLDGRKYSDYLGVNSPIIASNGSIVVDKTNQQVILKKNLFPETVFKLYELSEKYNLVISFHAQNEEYCNDSFNNYLNEIRKKNTQLYHQMTNEYRIIIEDSKSFKSLLSNQHEEILKGVLFSEDVEFLESLKEEIYRDLNEVEIVSSAYNNIEITAAGVSKGKALESLAKLYHINPENILAIGDSGNDISLIKYAGLGIAMGNAAQSLKDAADYITDSNDDDGVAKAINKYVL